MYQNRKACNHAFRFVKKKSYCCVISSTRPQKCLPIDYKESW